MKRLSKLSEVPAAVESRGSVHVIHPDEGELYFLCDFLAMTGFRSSGLSGSERALDYVGRTRPDVLICPLALPDAAGADVARQTRRLSPHTQVLLTSDQTLVPLPEGLRTVSGVDLLRGPFNAVGLLRAVERLIGRDPEGESGE